MNLVLKIASSFSSKRNLGTTLLTLSLFYYSNMHFFLIPNQLSDHKPATKCSWKLGWKKNVWKEASSCYHAQETRLHSPSFSSCMTPLGDQPVAKPLGLCQCHAEEYKRCFINRTAGYLGIILAFCQVGVW